MMMTMIIDSDDGSVNHSFMSSLHPTKKGARSVIKVVDLGLLDLLLDLFHFKLIR